MERLVTQAGLVGACPEETPTRRKAVHEDSCEVLRSDADDLRGHSCSPTQNILPRIQQNWQHPALWSLHSSGVGRL